MIYELEAYNTDRRFDDVRWREYTASRKKADLFARIPKIQFSDSGHGIVFSSRLHTGKRKPEIRILAEYVRAQLEVLGLEAKLNKPKGLSRKQLEALCKQLTEACRYSLNLELHGIGQHSHAIALLEAVLAEAKKLRVNP